MTEQTSIFDAAEQSATAFEDVTFKYVESVLGSGYEQKVSELAIHDKVAHLSNNCSSPLPSAFFFCSISFNYLLS